MVRRRLTAIVTAAVLTVVTAGCGDGTATTAPPAGPARYEASLTVLESPEHGPHLCENVLTSLPPQCSGFPVEGWDWDAVDGEERANGTIWGAWHVVGTVHDGTFRLTEPARAAPPTAPTSVDLSPACDDPDVVDDADPEAAWDAMADEPLDLPDLVTMWVSGSGPGSGPFVANVVVTEGAADEARAAIRRRYGGPLCVVEQGRVRRSDLDRVQQEVFDDEARAALGQVQSAGVMGRGAAITARIWVVDDEATTYARKRWGDLVELEGILRPVRG